MTLPHPSGQLSDAGSEGEENTNTILTSKEKALKECRCLPKLSYGRISHDNVIHCKSVVPDLQGQLKCETQQPISGARHLNLT